MQRWDILRTALPHTISLACIVALVNTLACLHNYCIDEANHLGVKENLQSRLSIDVQIMMENETGFIELQSSAEHGQLVPTKLLSPDEKILLTLQTHCCNNTDTIIQNKGCPTSSCMNELLRDIIEDWLETYEIVIKMEIECCLQ